MRAQVSVGLRVKAARGRGAYVRNISYLNVTVTSFSQHAIQVNDFYGARNPACGEQNVTAAPRLDNIEYVNVRAVTNLGSQPAADFEGLVDQPITRVRLQNVVLPGEAGASTWNCKQVAGRSTDVVPLPCKDLL